ncbi:MAG: DUF1501 domain-containing protein [Zavarzinella sp.]
MLKKSPKSLFSEHLSRRSILQGSLLAGGMAFGGFGSLFGTANAQEAKKKSKNVILLFMSGGPSQFETWDPKTGAPTGGPHLNIQTTIPSYRMDEYMPNLARLADKMAIIRSMTSELGDHMEAHYFAQTGLPPINVFASPPHWLSVCAQQRPAEDRLPTYVMLGQQSGGNLANPGPGFLGPKYQALVCPGGGKGPQDLPQVIGDADRLKFQQRNHLRVQLSKTFDQHRQTGPIQQHHQSFATVNNLLSQNKLFDITEESASTLEKYGPSHFGKDCILARRLVENGVPFVRVMHQNGLAWDKHRRAFENQRYLTTEFDQAAGALIDDLIDRGLWDSTLVILMGEFGRTPTIQGQGPPGRNHWTKSWSMSMGGCGVKPGVVLGATNKIGTEITERPVTIPDLFSTFYTLLGINPKTELEFEDRPIPLVEDRTAKVIHEVIS